MIGLKVEREVTETIPVVYVMSDLAIMADFYGELITGIFLYSHMSFRLEH